MVDNTLTRIGMPLQQFIEETNTKMFEFINGERRYKMPGVAGHNFVMHLIYRFLLEFLSRTRLGEVFTEATFVLPEAYDSDWVKGSRTPDVVFFAAERITAYRQAQHDWRSKPYLIVPDLVVEVVSPSDKLSEMDEKVDLYLADGVRLVIVADPQRRKVFVHSPDRENAQTLKGDMLLKGEDVLPGFEIAVSKLFE
jgi:Uma2 family endonuclease